MKTLLFLITRQPCGSHSFLLPLQQLRALVCKFACSFPSLWWLYGPSPARVMPHKFQLEPYPWRTPSPLTLTTSLLSSTLGTKITGHSIYCAPVIGRAWAGIPPARNSRYGGNETQAYLIHLQDRRSKCCKSRKILPAGPREISWRRLCSCSGGSLTGALGIGCCWTKPPSP